MNFSVLMSVYEKDHPLFFKDALTSIFRQTLMPTEIVLVKDGPLTEELTNVLEVFINKNPLIFKVLALPNNKGLGNALKAGLEICTNEIVVRMDSDDICYPNRFKKQIDYLNRNPHISVLGSAIEEFNETPGDLKRYRKLPLQNHRLVEFAKYRTPLNHPSVAFRKSHILDAGSYQDMSLFEDYYLWVRMIMKGYLIENLQEPLLHFRIGNDMIGRRHGLFYIKKEFAFLKMIRRMKFINNREFLLSIITKFPIRLLPKRQLAFFYKKILR